MTSQEPALAQKQGIARMASIDILRGLAMVVMALDHARNYFGPTAFDPLDAELSTPGWYITRWVTGFCAPVFVFLAGTSAFLVGQRMSKSDLSRRLLLRGLWLILLELTLIDLSWGFLIAGVWILQVIWAIGWSMIVLALLIRLPLPIIGAFGIAMIGYHNMFDHLWRPGPAFYNTDLWTVLHVQAPLNSTGMSYVGMPSVIVLYPLIPWIGVMALGYRFGSMLVKPRRDAICYATGGFMIVSFVLLRAFSMYGDTTIWSLGEAGPRNLMSFLHTQKYPPSLQFLLMTLGPAIFAMPLLEKLARALPRLVEPVRVFGNVAMFYYILHIPLTHISSGVLSLVHYHTWVQWAFSGQFPANYVPRLWLVYAAWIGIVLTLYVPCAWYARYKRKHKYWWMSYV